MRRTWVVKNDSQDAGVSPLYASPMPVFIISGLNAGFGDFLFFILLIEQVPELTRIPLQPLENMGLFSSLF
jgi:hypothetical protein